MKMLLVLLHQFHDTSYNMKRLLVLVHYFHDASYNMRRLLVLLHQFHDTSYNMRRLLVLLHQFHDTSYKYNMRRLLVLLRQCHDTSYNMRRLLVFACIMYFPVLILPIQNTVLSNMIYIRTLYNVHVHCRLYFVQYVLNAFCTLDGVHDAMCNMRCITTALCKKTKNKERRHPKYLLHLMC